MHKRCANCFEILSPRAKKCSACGVLLSSVKNQDDIAAGTILANRYYVGRVYKEEPASIVYFGFDEKTESKVFIRKFLLEKICFSNMAKSGFSSRDRILERFLNYGKSMASLSICRLMPRTVDVFIENDNAYIVYEFFEAESLQSLLEANVDISPKSAVKIIGQLCDGLAVLHGAHTIYGAISPDTLYISNTGAVYLFGISSPFYDFVEDVDERAKLLSPSFSAPELFLKELKCGTYSDVYSLAAVLYRILCKQEPPIGFLRSLKDSILSPHKANDSATKSVSIAVLNALNWHIPARTKSLNLFLRELTAPKVARKLSLRGVASCLCARVSRWLNNIKEIKNRKSNKL